jgi:UDP-glucose 4-epimerase
MKKNILIIGGAGYVGGAFTDFIDTNKYNVVVYDALLFERQR